MKLKFFRGAWACVSGMLLFSSLSAGDETDVIYRTAVSDAQVYAELVDIIGLDALGLPVRQATLAAELKRHNKRFFRTVTDTQVEFSVQGGTVGFAETDKNGVARIHHFVESTGTYIVSVRLAHNDLFKATTGYGLLKVVSPEQPLLLIDFDSAMYRGLSGKFDYLGAERLRPIEGASESLTALSEKYQIVYFTEWEISELPKIRRWMLHWKMPKAPVLFWDGSQKVLKTGDWKTRELTKYLKGWRNPKAAVSGSVYTINAFRDNKIKTIGIKSGLMPRSDGKANWREVRGELEKN